MGDGIEPFFPFECHSEFSVPATANKMLLAVFVLADLSLERPSCYFELGLAQAVGAHVFLIAATGTQIQQVGDSRRPSFYSDFAQYRLRVSRLLGGSLTSRGR